MPAQIASGAVSGNTGGGSLAVTMPPGFKAGDVILVWCTSDNPSTTDITDGSGTWARLLHTAYTSNVIKGALFAKLAAGGDTLTLTCANQDVVAISGRVISHGVSDVTTDIILGTPATGSSGAPNPPNVNPGVSDDWLVIESFHADDDDDTPAFWSANYTPLVQAESAASTSSCHVGVAFRVVEAASSEDPGAMALAATEEWIANTIAIPSGPMEFGTPLGVLDSQTIETFPTTFDTVSLSGDGATPGNILTAHVSIDKSAGAFDTLSDWIDVTDTVGANVSGKMYYRIADGTSADDFVGAWDTPQADPIAVMHEWYGTGQPVASPSPVAVNSGATAATTRAVDPGTTPATGRFAIVQGGMDTRSGAGVVTYTNGYVHRFNSNIGVIQIPHLIVASLGVSSGDPTATTITFDVSDQNYALGVIFEEVGPDEWPGEAAVVEVAGQGGEWVAAPFAWTGAAGAVDVVGVGGEWGAEAASWPGTAGTVDVEGVGGEWSLSAMVWPGGAAAVDIAGIGGEWSIVAMVWPGDAAAVEVEGAGGEWSIEPVGWPGAAAVVDVDAAAGEWSIEPIAWVGAAGVVDVEGVGGEWSIVAMVWPGSAAVVDVEGVAGGWDGAATDWPGGTAVVAVEPLGGGWALAAVAWPGAAATVDVAGGGGPWAGEAVAWPGAAALVDVAGVAGPWALAPVEWPGAAGVVDVEAVGGGWVGNDGIWAGAVAVVVVVAVAGGWARFIPRNVTRVAAEDRTTRVAGEDRTSVVGFDDRTTEVPAGE